MKSNKSGIRWFWVWLPAIIAGAAGCTPPVDEVDAYTDPFAYCAALGTIDAPDARYTGEAVPEVVIRGFIRAAELAAGDEALDTFHQTTIWRCMNGQVYACNFGANLPCDSKADTSTEPTREMKDFCAQNPGADAIPMSVTGHTVIYSWGCQGDTPEIRAQIDQADEAGYLSRIWYTLEPQ